MFARTGKLFPILNALRLNFGRLAIIFRKFSILKQSIDLFECLFRAAFCSK